MITGLDWAVGGGDQPFLDDRDPLDRDLDAQVAARHHHAVGGADDLVQVIEGDGALDLGDHERVAARLGRRGPHRLDIDGRADERLADRVDSLLEGETQALAVAGGERRNAQVDAGQVQTLARAQFAARHHPAEHVLARHALNLELDQSVVEEQGGARPNDPRQAREVHRRAAGVPDRLPGGQGELVAAAQLDRLTGDRADTHLRARKVG